MVGIAFHRPNAFASKLTLGTDNKFHFGGWSDETDGATVVASKFEGKGDSSFDGKVGIGTTSPGAKLEVAGNIIASNPIDGNNVATKDYVDTKVATAASTSCSTVGMPCG